MGKAARGAVVGEMQQSLAYISLEPWPPRREGGVTPHP